MTKSDEDITIKNQSEGMAKNQAARLLSVME